MRITSFGAVIFPQFNARQQLPVSYRSAVIPLRGGGFDQDGRASHLEPKVITVNYWVSEDDGGIDDFINSLYSESALGRRLLIASLRDDSLWQAEAKLIQASTGPDARVYFPDSLQANAGYEPMSVSFEITYPYWLVAEDTGKFLDEGWYMDSGITLDSGQQTLITTSDEVNEFTIDNNGGVAHEFVELNIVALTGTTIVDVLVENLTTGEEIEWTGTIATGETLTINTLPQTIQLDGANEYANTVIPSTQIGFFTLALGDNDFRITFTSVSGGNAEITFKWSRHYVR